MKFKLEELENNYSALDQQFIDELVKDDYDRAVTNAINEEMKSVLAEIKAHDDRVKALKAKFGEDHLLFLEAHENAAMVMHDEMGRHWEDIKDTVEFWASINGTIEGLLCEEEYQHIA